VAAKKAKISELHDAERASQDKLTATEVKLAEIREELARAVAGANRDSKTASKKIAFLQRQLQLADKEKTEAARRAVEFEETVSFQLGKAIIESTQSWRNLAKLPAEIVRLRRDGVARRAARESRSDSSSAGKSEPANVPNSARKIGPASQQAIKETQAAFRARTANPKSMLRVASVMDEFTCHSFAPECNLLQLHPKTWREQLSQFKPDLVFIESAWRGLDDLWKTKISNSETEVLDIVEWCIRSTSAHFSTLPVLSIMSSPQISIVYRNTSITSGMIAFSCCLSLRSRSRTIPSSCMNEKMPFVSRVPTIYDTPCGNEISRR
jgi:hypothetical protein